MNCLKLRKRTSCVLVKLNFVKIYALKGWALSHADQKPKGLKLGWGFFQKLSWYHSNIKDLEF